MKKEWIANATFAALVSATYYFLQHAMESAQVPPSRASVIAALASGVLVGVGLRFAVTVTPLRIGFIRRILLPACKIEGKWLEILDRKGNRNYTIVDLEYNPAGETDPFKMEGHSFLSSGKEHSEWSTQYLKVKLEPITSIEYVYMVTRGGSQYGRPAYGYGESWFTGPGRGKPLDRGHGYYLAAEEDPLERCKYDLQRIDDAFKNLVEFSLELDLNDHFNMEKFVKCVHTYHLRTP